MSFSPFKEVNINNPGTATVYGSDDFLEIMRILNGIVVSNRRIDIRNPWRWLDNFDVVAAAVAPPNPGANAKRFYVDPSDTHFKMKSSGGTVVDFDTLGEGAVGEVNTASNIGTAGVGVWKDKVSSDLRFKKINAGSTKITITDDTSNNEVDVDVSEANLNLNNVGSTLGVSKGGTGVNTVAANGLLRGAGSSPMTVIAPGSDTNVLTMVAGVPTWAASTASADTKVIVFEGGVQVGSVSRRINFTNDDDFVVAENAPSDRFDLSLIRSEVMVGHWFSAPGVTKTNIPTTYTDVFVTTGTEGNGCDVDGTGKNDFRLYVSWNKNAGSGTHSLQIISQTTSDVLATISDLATGRNVATGVIPTFFQNNIRSVKAQARSTVATDDPICYNVALYYK